MDPIFCTVYGLTAILNHIGQKFWKHILGTNILTMAWNPRLFHSEDNKWDTSGNSDKCLQCSLGASLLYPFSDRDPYVCTYSHTSAVVVNHFATPAFEYHKVKIHVMTLLPHSWRGATSGGAAQFRLPNFLPILRYKQPLTFECR